MLLLRLYSAFLKENVLLRFLGFYIDHWSCTTMAMVAARLSGSVLLLIRSCSKSGPVNRWMGDRLWAGKPS